MSKTSEVIYDPIEGLACDLTTLSDGADDYADCTTGGGVTPNNIPGAIVATRSPCPTRPALPPRKT